VVRLAALVVLLGLSLAGQDSKTIDFSTSRGSTRYYVVFAARNDTRTGHAFVIWGVEDDRKRRSTIKAMGLYPEYQEDDWKSVVRLVPGTIVDEQINHSLSSIAGELILKVDAAAYQESLKTASVWECKHEFAVLRRDCVEFLRDVGTSLGLDMPRRMAAGATPHAYVQALLAGVSMGKRDFGEAMYEGSLLEGRPTGHGMLSSGSFEISGTFWGLEHQVGEGWISDEERIFRYEGDIVDYQPHGRGTIQRYESVDGPREVRPILSGRFENGLLRTVIRRFERDVVPDIGFDATPAALWKLARHPEP